MAVAAQKIKSERLEARVTPEAKALFERAARIQGRSFTDFVVNSALEAARRAVRDHEIAELTQHDRIAFIEALLASPPAPNAKLRSAVARHARVFGK